MQIRKYSSLAGVVVLACQLNGCRTDCDPTLCPVVDQNAGAGDTRVEFSPGYVESISFDDAEGMVKLKGGEVVFQTTDPGCLATSLSPCTITLKRLQLRVEPVIVEANVGEMELTNAVLSVEAPFTLVDRGSGYVIAAGVKVHTCLEVDGIRDHGVAVLTEPASLWIERYSTGLYVNFVGSMPFVFHATSSICQEIQGQVAGAVNGFSSSSQLY